MRQLIGALAAACVTAVAGAASASAPTLQINDAVVRVTISPEARSDIQVEVVRGNPRLPLKIWSFLGRTYVDGGLWHRLRGCGGGFAQPYVTVAGVGPVSYAQMPQIVVHAPLDVRVAAGGAVWGVVGKSQSVDLGAAGCGAWALADVRGKLKVSQAGSGAVRTGSAAAAELYSSGSGSIATGPLAGPVTAINLGSGDIDIASMNGPLGARIAGSGRIRVNGGRATMMEASIAGSGDIALNGVAGSLKASIMGSGDVHVARVTGAVSKSVMGSGSVRIGS
ncbi:MAG TPA: DUF2807 domain-containing protein [Caulobacteraceae bacterium]|nr:DUF2807 domain-containing protein [Caulobacteraceae bacterium]